MCEAGGSAEAPPLTSRVDHNLECFRLLHLDHSGRGEGCLSPSEGCPPSPRCCTPPSPSQLSDAAAQHDYPHACPSSAATAAAPTPGIERSPHLIPPGRDLPIPHPPTLGLLPIMCGLGVRVHTPPSPSRWPRTLRTACQWTGPTPSPDRPRCFQWPAGARRG